MFSRSLFDSGGSSVAFNTTAAMDGGHCQQSHVRDLVDGGHIINSSY